MEPDPDSSLAAGDPGGDVQEPVTDLLRLGGGEFAARLQKDGLGPGEQVGGGEGEFEPGGVDLEVAGGEPAVAGVLAAADPVLDPGMGAVPGFQSGQLPGAGVGGEGLEPVAVDVAEGELGAGMRPFTADDDAHPGWPAVGFEVQTMGLQDTAEFGDYVSGTRVIDQHVKDNMKAVLADIQSGAFAKRFIDDQDAGAPEFKKLRAEEEQHPIETTGRELRALFSWQGGDDDYTEGTAAR